MSGWAATQWLKSMILDIVVTLVILSTVIVQVEWLRVIVLIYTGLVFVIRIAVYFNDTTLRAIYSRMDQMPSWPIHLLYGVNVVLAIIGSMFVIAGMWCGIWIFSFLSEKKGQKYNQGK